MTYHGHPIFTDVIKDVIGNDPVLDQFDISYAASFYGSMQDDYVTGTILTEFKVPLAGSRKSTNNKERNFSTGTVERGRAVSKYYADTSAVADSTYGSKTVKDNPSLSYRALPWTMRTSKTAYRTLQCYDSSERYYDSCLPDLQRSLKATDSQLWALSQDNLGDRWLSPWNNVFTGSVGYIMFNSPEEDYTKYGFSNDPLVNNDWTWSYPYETKYSPDVRLTKTDRALGFNRTDLEVTKNFALVTNITQSNPREISGIIPLLPGYYPRDLLPSGSRNAFRATYSVSGSEGIKNQAPTNYNDTRQQDRYGYSFLIPTDVNLSRKNIHTAEAAVWTDYDIGSEYLTGTMTPSDTVKVLFGFGDFNNMTYGKYQFSTGSGVALDISGDSFNNGTLNGPASTTTAFSGAYLQADWSSSPDGSSTNSYTQNAWRVRNSSVTFNDNADVLGEGGSPAVPLSYYTISGSTSGPAAGRGLFWRTYEGQRVLVSDTATSLGGNLDYTDFKDSVSYAVLDVTSSYPWSLRYNRAVVAHQEHYLLTYFASTPFYRSQDLGWLPTTAGYATGPIIEVVTGSATAASTTAPSFRAMKTYDSMINGLGDNPLTNTDNPAYPYPFDPGAYRIVFAFVQYSGSAGSTNLGSPSIAAIDSVKVVQYFDNCFEPLEKGQKIGCNNYPYFVEKRIDMRPSPYDVIGPQPYLYAQPGGLTQKYAGKPLAELSKEVFKSYIFGVSPQIRGWKYGLYNGLPTHTKAIFRRNRYGQLRDMLEQRQYTKFVTVLTSPTDNEAITKEDATLSQKASKAGTSEKISQAVVDVNFVKQRYRKDDRGIGRIFVEKVSPELTYSQNLSYEVTSSLPYFDGVAKHRQESDILAIKDVTTVAVSIGTSNLTIS